MRAIKNNIVHMTNYELVKKAQSAFMGEERTGLRTGMEVEIHQKIVEWEKERIQKFKGIIINVAGKTPLEKMITVRKKVGPFGVEKIFPIHSPSVAKIEILRQFKVKKKSIAFIRHSSGKESKLKEIK